LRQLDTNMTHMEQWQHPNMNKWMMGVHNLWTKPTQNQSNVAIKIPYDPKGNNSKLLMR